MDTIILVKDLQENFKISYSKACQIMREIKSVSDILCVKGRVLRIDYENWLNKKSNSKEGCNYGAISIQKS